MRYGRPRKGRTYLSDTSISLYQQRLAQPTLTYDLRQQRPGTCRPSGLVKLLHNDNVVLTQVCCYRGNATTAAPATTSNFDEDEDVVRDAAGERPRFSCQVSGTTILLRLAPTTTIVTAASSGGQRGGRRGKG